MLVLALAGCVFDLTPLSHDLSDEPLPDAVSQALDLLEDTYAFTEHRGLDWDAARDELLPLAEAAEGREASDEVVRRLLLTLPDAHSVLFNADPERDACPAVRGDLGVVLADLDTGQVIVARSDHAVLEAGDVVVSVDGVPVEEARDQVSYHCFPIGMGTQARIDQVELRLLARAEVGAEVSLGVERAGLPVEAVLEAAEVDVGLRENLDIEPPERLIRSRMLGDDIGYIELGWEETGVTTPRFEHALRSLHADGARSLVLDLRDNDGGTDQVAANIVGYFSDRDAWFYETITMYDRRTESQDVISEVWVERQDLYWSLPVVVLVSADTVSSGEGMAMMLAQLDHVTVMGFEGTAAAFGSAGSSIALPGGWELTYAAGRSLDRQGNIQLDSDHTLRGGVSPEVVVPWTADNRISQANGDDVALAHARSFLEAL